MKKTELARITNVSYNRFTLDGVEWRAGIAGHSSDEPHLNFMGFSPRGIWTDFTDGTRTVRINKADLLAIDREKAVALFNGN
jgi:hypothetical protein